MQIDVPEIIFKGLHKQRGWVFLLRSRGLGLGWQVILWCGEPRNQGLCVHDVGDVGARGAVMIRGCDVGAAPAETRTPRDRENGAK